MNEYERIDPDEVAKQLGAREVERPPKSFAEAMNRQWNKQGRRNQLDNDSIILAATMFGMTLREVRSALGLDPNNAEWNDITDAIAALKKEVEKAKWEARSNKGMHPMDEYVVRKIRANIIAGNREQARGYYCLDDWVLKAIENNELFPQAQPISCPTCGNGVVVSSISSCQSCYHCSNTECDYCGCSNMAGMV